MAKGDLAADPGLTASAKTLLITELNRLREEAGRPSLGELVRLGKGKFSKSTLDDHLAGKRVTIPNWRLTSAYVTACHEAAKETGISIYRLGTLEEWRIRWAAARNGDRDAASPIRESDAIATYKIDPKEMESNAEDDSFTLIQLKELDYRLSGKSSGTSDITTAGITTITRDIEESLSRLRDSLTDDTGLLVVTSGPGAGAKFSIDRDLTTIGRAPDSDVFLDDPTVSRRHAVIHRYGNRFTARDAGSRNSTFVHQKRISKETPLGSYDELQCGAFRMLFIQGG
ncbi:MAG TPA: FHA domain-containing protein [Streptosporangiaceae bacterium]|nr:FHA domain-containing protein [Streptosporangiaceae bacterium]